MISRPNFKTTPREKFDYISLKFQSVASVSAFPELAAFDRLYNKLKGTGIWDKMYRIFPMGTSCSLVCAKTQNILTAVNSPAQSITTDPNSYAGGWTFNGTSTYLQGDKITGGNLSATDMHTYILCQGTPATTKKSVYGKAPTNLNTWRLQGSYNAPNKSITSQAFVISGSSQIDYVLSTGASAYTSMCTTGKNGLRYFEDGVFVQASSAISMSGSVPTGKYAIGCHLQVGDTPTSYSAITVGFFCYGAYLDDTQVAILDAAAKQYRIECFVPLAPE